MQVQTAEKQFLHNTSKIILKKKQLALSRIQSGFKAQPSGLANRDYLVCFSLNLRAYSLQTTKINERQLEAEIRQLELFNQELFVSIHELVTDQVSFANIQVSDVFRSVLRSLKLGKASSTI